MVTAEELTVAIRSEGVGETQDKLQGVEDSMDETAQSAGESAEQLEGFSQRFAGAMGAAVTALAVGAAGLLSQVPVLGEVFSGLAAIVSAVAFQMDGVLRPVLSPLTDLFFGISEAIFEADGVLGDIIGTVASVVSVLAIIAAGMVQFGVSLGSVVSAAGSVISVLGTIAGAIGTLIGVIAGLPVALVAALAALTGFIAAYLTNWRGTREKTDQIVSDIIDFVVGGFKSLGSDLVAWADGLADSAFTWGRNVIQGFLNGLRSLINRVQDLLGGLGDIGANFGLSVGGGGGSSSGGGGGGLLGGLFGGGGGGGISLDGRSLSESTGRYRADPSRRRGL